MGVVELSALIIVFLNIVINGKNKEKTITILGILGLFFISALRNPDLGTDTIRYVENYERNAMYDFETMKSVLSWTKDPIYYYSAWLFSRLFENAQWWLAAIAALFSITHGRLIYKYSDKTAVSLVMLISLGFFSFSMTGLRQTIAMSILLISYPFIKERKLIPFIITVLIASLFHKTAWIFLIIYPMANLRIGKYHFIIAIIAFILFYAFQGKVLELLNSFLQEDRYTSYLSGNARQATYSGLIIQAVCFAFSMYYYKTLTEQDKGNLLLYNFAFLGLVFQLFSSFIAEFFRISMYFSVFNILLIAKASNCEPEARSRSIAQIAVIAVFILYMLWSGTSEYRFLWQ